ncbi:MAG: four helix bundle protein [Akkermansia sp.]|nr:four helix bundle protein [Akkermansia sp.]
MDTASADERKHADLRQRTKDFGLRIIRMWKSLPNTAVAHVLGKQLLRSATSVAANYRAACIAKSEADFYNKIKICQEEADESILWIEYLIEGEILPETKLSSLLDEARQLAAIMTASSLTVQKRLKK